MNNKDNKLNLNFNTTAYNIVLYYQLNEILTAFKTANIKTIILKGAALAETIYPHIGLRPMSDIDLLIKENDLVLAQQKLTQLGFLPLAKSCTSYIKKEKIPVIIDLHTNIKYFKNLEKVWKNSKQATIANIDTLIMSPEDSLVYFIAHLSLSHAKALAKWLMDINLLIRHYPDINWDTVEKLSQENNLSIPTYYVLAQVQEQFSTPIPANILNIFKPQQESFIKEKIMKLILNKDSHLPLADYLLPIIFQEGFNNKFKLIFLKLFPPEKIMYKRYEIKSIPTLYFYYLLRPCLLFLKGLTAICYMMLSFLKRFLKIKTI